MCVESEGCMELEDYCVGRTGATCNDQRERMPWREFRVGGMGVCLAYASAYRKQGHGYMLRTPLNIVYIASVRASPARLRPSGSRPSRSRAGTARASTVAVGIGRHYLEGTVRTSLRRARSQLVIGHRS